MGFTNGETCIIIGDKEIYNITLCIKCNVCEFTISFLSIILQYLCIVLFSYFVLVINGI